MGSSHFWQNCRDIPSKNLIPLEIASKIISKINNGESFAAYIVIPMFPEGNPTDVAIQEMLHWQYHTMEMMYAMIGNAISNQKIDAHPQDFLMFFCLGENIAVCLFKIRSYYSDCICVIINICIRNKNLSYMPHKVRETEDLDSLPNHLNLSVLQVKNATRPHC